MLLRATRYFVALFSSALRTLFLALVAGTLLFSLTAAEAATLTLISITRNGSAIVITFQAAQGSTYRLQRKLAACNERATSSLPVPLSP